MKQKRDYTGMRVGKVVVERELDNDQWLCMCDCGNECIKSRSTLNQALWKGSKNTACSSCQHIKDLTGQKFGRLMVLGPGEPKITPKGYKIPTWHCRCDCGNEKDIRDYSLKSGNIKSCGCLVKDTNGQKKGNKYDLETYEFGVGWTLTGVPFFFDKEDFDKIKQYTWFKNNDGYLISRDHRDSPTLLLHRIVTNCEEGKEVDHIHGIKTRNDNRKENLRIVEHRQNAMNKSYARSNTGYLGVSQLATGQYISTIGINYQKKYLGTFNTLQEAVDARREAEQKYHKEYSFNSRPKDYIDPNEIIGDKHA